MMPHDFADLIADLDAAKANLARKVKRARTLIGKPRIATAAAEASAPDKSVFNWPDRADQ